MFSMSLVVQQFLFITYDVQRKQQKKENFTYTKRNPQNEVISNLKSFMINDPQKGINSHFHPFFMTSEHLSHFSILFLVR